MDDVCKVCWSAPQFCICGEGASHVYHLVQEERARRGEIFRDYAAEYFKLLADYEALKAAHESLLAKSGQREGEKET